MTLLYNIFLLTYLAAIRVAATFNKKAALWIQGRKGWRQNLKENFKKNKKTAWFHAASLGEFEQARPVIELFRQKHPDYQILLSFFSPSGYEIRKHYDQVDLVCYLPIDTKRNARWFVNYINPEIVFFVKYEFWFNYIEALSSKNIPIYFFSVIFRPSQHFFKWYGGWFRKRLAMIKHFYVQNSESEVLLKSIGIDKCSVSGDTRFDRVLEIASENTKISFIEEFIDGNTVLVAGSTWETDEEKLFSLYKEHREIKFIIAPHEISKQRIVHLEQVFEGAIRYSKCRNNTNIADFPVLIIDTIGMLSSLYRYANISYIGGGFGKGIHNTLEAAVYGVPVVFGPKYNKFSEAKALIALRGGYSISTSKELIAIVERVISGEILGDICRDYIVENAGASKKIIQLC